MDFAALKTEIETDPQALGFAAHVANQTDQPLADLLNAKSFTLPGKVPIDFLVQFVAKHGLIAPLEEHSDNPLSEVRSIAQAALIMLKWPPSFAFDLADALNRVMVHQLVAAGVMMAAQRDELFAKADIAASRAEVLFGAGTVITAEQVARALRGLNG